MVAITMQPCFFLRAFFRFFLLYIFSVFFLDIFVLLCFFFVCFLSLCICVLFFFACFLVCFFFQVFFIILAFFGVCFFANYSILPTLLASKMVNLKGRLTTRAPPHLRRVRP